MLILFDSDPFKDVSMEEVIAAARKANIHQFITNLPQVRGGRVRE